jgi:hypothetical protein
VFDFVLQGISAEDGENYTWDGEYIIPDTNYFGPLSVPVSLNDGMDQSPIYIVDLFVSPVNDAPVFETTVLDTVIEDTLFEMSIYFSDVDGSEDIDTYSVTAFGSATGWLGIDSVFSLGDGEYGFIISGLADDQDLANNFISLSVSDGYDEIVLEYFFNMIAVNDAGFISGFSGDSLFNEDTQLVLGLFDFVVDDPDNTFPGDYVGESISVGVGDYYSWDGEYIIPDTNYFGPLSVPYHH